jgi:serine protease Do
MKSGVRNAAILLSLFSVVFLAWAARAADPADDGPWIGVYTQSIDKDLKEAFDLDRTDGILIVDVMKGSPAEKAGLRRRDIVIKFDGKAVDGSIPMVDLVKDTKPGDKIDLVYVRNGEEKSTTLEVGTRESSKGSVLAITPNRTPYSGSRSYGRTFHMDTESDSYIGVSIQDLNDQLGSYFGVSAGEGVLITEVSKDSPAEKAGLKAGDVVIGVDRKKVESSEDLQSAITSKKKGDEITVNVLRNKQKLDIKVEVGEDTDGVHALVMPKMPMQLPSMPQFKLFGGSGDDAQSSDAIKELREEIKQLRHELEDLKDKMK